MLDLLVEFRSILAALQRAGVECAVCGGLAMAIHSRPRATLDVDLWIRREQLEPAKQTVRALGYRIEAGLPVVSRAGLARMKRLRGSGQDLDDIGHLEDGHHDP